MTDSDHGQCMFPADPLCLIQTSGLCRRCLTVDFFDQVLNTNLIRSSKSVECFDGDVYFTGLDALIMAIGQPASFMNFNLLETPFQPRRFDIFSEISQIYFEVHSKLNVTLKLLIINASR